MMTLTLLTRLHIASWRRNVEILFGGGIIIYMFIGSCAVKLMYRAYAYVHQPDGRIKPTSEGE